jgi:hypothetical protein
MKKDEPNGKKAFKKVFEENKATNLFKGIKELHDKYGQLSEAGSHPTLQSWYNKVTTYETPSTKGLRMSYTGALDARST